MLLINYFNLLVGIHNIVAIFFIKRKENTGVFWFCFFLKGVYSKRETASLGCSGLLRADRISCKSCLYKSCLLSGFYVLFPFFAILIFVLSLSPLVLNHLTRSVYVEKELKKEHTHFDS